MEDNNIPQTSLDSQGNPPADTTNQMRDITQEQYRMPDVNPVNLGGGFTDYVGELNTAYREPAPSQERELDYKAIMRNNLDSVVPKEGPVLKNVTGDKLNFSGRYPVQFVGRDNEEMYAQQQTTLDKAYNGVVKFAGTATNTFINGTAGTVYGIYRSVADQKLSSFYDNPLSNELNDMSAKWEDQYAHYKTKREINGDWYEPENLFTANFLFDNIIKNLGFSVGAMGAGFAWGGAIRAIGMTGKLVGTGAKWATAADNAIAESALLPEAQRMGALSNKLNGIFNSAKSVAGQGLMKADRGIVATFGTFGEAGMEALNNSKEYRNKAIENFKAVNGYDPSEQDIAQINKEAEQVGNWSFGLNTALLSVTNYVQLPKIYSSSFKAEKNIMNGVVHTGEDYVSSLPTKGFGKRLHQVKNLASLGFNTSEAFEEGAQYAIQTGTQNYFDRKSKDQGASALKDGLLFGVKEALTSNEGTLNIFTGGFSGALQSSGIVGIKKSEAGIYMPTVGGTGKIGERGLTGYGGTQAVERQQAITDLNNTRIKGKLKDAFSNLVAGESIQADREIAIRQGDVLESKDLEFDYAHTFVETRLKYKAKDAIDFELDSLKEQALTDEGFNKLQQEGYAPESDTKQSFIARLNNLQNHANQSAKLYDALNLKYSGFVDENGKRIYDDLVIDKLVYAGSKINDYDKRIQELNSNLMSSNVNTLDIMDSIINEGMPTDDALAKGFGQIDAMKGVTEDEKENLQRDLLDVTEMAVRRADFIKEYNNIRSNPKEHSQTEEVETPVVTEDQPAQTIKIKTKYGERDIKVGEEYVLGKVTKFTTTGKEVYRQPRLTVIGENEDGTIKIKEANGTVRDITPEKFEDYSLTPASELSTNKKFAFFEKHQNSIFINRAIKDKDGNPVKGRLQYNTADKRKLNFVYKDKNGKIKTREVWNTMFVAQKGYKQPIMEVVGQLTPAQEQAQQEFIEEQDKTVAEKNEERFEILATLSEEVIARAEKTEKLIAQKIKQIEGFKEDYDRLSEILATEQPDKRYKNIFKFKTRASEALKSVMELSRMLEQLNEEVVALEAEKEDLEYTSQYIEDFADNLEELPTSGKDLLFQLRYDRLVLGDAIIANNKALSTIHRLINSLEKAIESAISALKGLLKTFSDRYPNVPSPTGQEWVDYLKTNPMFLFQKDQYKDEFRAMEDYLSYVEDQDITPNEKKIEDLKEHADIIAEELKELEKELKAHDVIHDRFKQIAKEYREGKRQEAQNNFNSALKEEFIGTNDSSVQNEIVEGDYEPAAKKDATTVVRSTIVPDSDKEHHVRADRFGNRFNTLDDKDAIRGVTITAKNEDKLIPGLMNRLATDPTTGELVKGVDLNKIIALVFVKDTPSGPTLVDEFGKEIADLSTDKLDRAVYQVFPLEDLEANYQDGNGKQSMFRESVSPEDVTKLKEAYKGWRDKQLKKEDVGQLEDVQPSFGILDYVTYKDESGKDKRDYNARINVEDSGLVTDEDLLTKPVVQVGINDTVTNGSVTFTNAVGRVFLRVANGLVPLNNRKFNEREVDLLYDVMLQTAKNAARDGNLKSTDTKRLFTWLRSVAYWGTAKNQDGSRKEKPGYNNIWFDMVTEENGQESAKLFISGKGYNVDYTPTALKRDEYIIKQLLSDLYFNTNASLVNDVANPLNGNSRWNTPYYEITGLDKEGQPITRKWDNYQSFLLSPKEPNSEGELTDKRSLSDLPLTTNVRPLLGKEDQNRKAIYFTLTNTTDDVNAPEEPAKKETPEAPKKQTPVKPVPKAVAGAIVMDGETNNKISIAGTDFNYTVDINLIEDNTIPKIVKGLDFELPEAALVGIVASALDQIDAETARREGKPIPAPRKADAYNPSNYDEAVFNKLLKSVLFKVATAVKEQLDSQEVKEPDPIEEPEPPITEDPTPQQVVAEEEQKEDDDIDDEWDSTDDTAPDMEMYRVAVEQETQYAFTPEKWEDVEKFVKQAFPNIPFYRVKNIIQATNGRQAWGMLQDGAIYVYENAEVGTAYHEVFEAVWKMFSDNTERTAINKEFRDREGDFIDRETGELTPYSKATNHQIKEQLAEEFRDHVLVGNAKPKSLIRRMFDELINFIREFFAGKDAEHNTKKLFDKIGNGYYAKYNPYETRLSYANMGIIDVEEVNAGPMAEFRLEDIPIAQQNEIIQYMTFATLRDAIKDNRGLFNVVPENKQELYDRLKKEVLALVKRKASEYGEQATDKKITKAVADREVANLKNLFKNISASWDKIIVKHQNHLKAYSIEFDENDDLNVNSDEKRKDDTYGDARQIDSFRKASSAVKLMLGTISETMMVNGKPIIKPSSIGGNIMIPGDRVFITLMNKLHDSVNIDDMLNRVRGIAINDPNYQAIYKRMTKTIADGDPRVFKPVDYSVLDEHDLHLISAFWKTMKKQNADAVTVFVLPTGEVIVSDSTLTSAAKQSKREMINNITDTIKSDKTKFFTYSNGKYNPTNTVVNYTLDPKKPETYTNFLNSLGIEFPLADVKKLDPDQMKVFRDSIEGIKRSMSTAKDLVTLNTKTLDIDGRLFNLGTVKAFIDNPEFESTYFNINGDKTQTYLGTNIVSSFYDVVSKLNNINELSSNPEYSQYSYLNTDVFTKGSMVLQKMFLMGKSGKRIAGTENLFRPVYIDGTINEETGKKKESSKLTYKERVVQEINLNLNGIFMNLVPGDASIEWGIKMYDADSPFVSNEAMQNKDYSKIFKDYFLSEVDLSRDNRKVAGKAEKSKDLRFFKDILSPKVYTKIQKEIADGLTAEDVYTKNKAGINKDVDDFVNREADKTADMLSQYSILKYNEGGKLYLENVELPEFNTDKDLKDAMRTLAINYMISNIEMHKLIYSDPYQYKDELKRIKNFNSPRQPLIAGSALINSSLNTVYNKGFSTSDIGYTDMTRDHFRTATIADVWSVNDLPGYDNPYEETDGGGYISSKANRVFGIRSGEWTSDNERQYRYDIAYEKTMKNMEMSNSEKELYAQGNPGIKDTYTPKKPITAGNKANGRDYNDIVLHKFALVPLSYRILHEMNPDSNAIKLYNKMQKEDVDYVVYSSGSKVGTEAVSPLYNEDGTFNEAPFETPEQANNPDVLQGISKMPFAIVSVQSEVPSKDTPLVRQGTQITKLATMDFMEAGVPIDFMPDAKFEERFVKWNEAPLEVKFQSKMYKEIVNNQNLLEAKIVEGYNVLLKKLGIAETPQGYVLSDTDKLVTTLKDEVLKREINENIINALTGLDTGSVIIEATPVYQQIRNILFSIADKNVVSPKISGGMKVQIPSALLESSRVKAQTVNGKQVHTSDVLSFYKNEDGKRVCEVMVGRWFKSSMSDQELLDYLNNTPEGQKILGGVGFRIPTQKQNSIDVFKIKQFLPKDFGDSIVIPSALVKKAGSDFDIDKLSIYLKNVFSSFQGKPQIVPFLGIGQQAKDEFALRFDRGEFFNKKQFDDLQKEIELFRQGKSEGKLIEAMFADFFTEEEALTEEDILRDLVEELTDKGIKQTLVDSLYMKSIENEYIESLERLISSPENFDNLIKPNDASQLQNLAKEINEKLGRPEIDYSSPGNMLSRTFMSALRQAFVSGKYAIGIAAVGQTGHAQRQRTAIYVDVERMDRVPEDDKPILGNNPTSNLYARDTNINFKEYNKAVIDGKERPVLAMIKNKAGDFISDINGQFIDGYVDISKGPWIMELGATPNVTSTWLYLVDLGVPIKTVAYFMNQPIVKDYLASVENNGYSWLFIDTLIEDALLNYASEVDSSSIKGIPVETKLGKLVGKPVEKMNGVEKAEQQYILKEFLKYAKMASHVFLVTQGSNFDTATLNDPYLIFKKEKQYEKGQNTIISSIDNLANSSFINVLRNTISDVRNAMSTILLSDRNDTTEGKQSIRAIMEQVLEPFVNMGDRDFVKTSQKAVADLFDWAMQTNVGYNKVVASTLLGNEKQESVAKQIIEYRNKVLKDKKHPLHSNIIIQSLRLESGTKEGKPDNLSITAKDGKAYNQDLVIGGFRELRDNSEVKLSGLYNKLVRLAIMQSGLTNSPISFSQLLPYEDFKEVYNETLSELERLPGLEKYLELNVFQRNNWNNSDVVPQQRANLRKSKTGRMFNANEAFVDKKLKNAMNINSIPKVINISQGSQVGRSEFLVYSWDKPISASEKAKMRKAGDYSYINKMLMQKVYTIDDQGNRVPLVQYSNYQGKDYFNFVYKGINAWGDSFRAQEFYDTNRPSVLENDFVKILDEVSDNKIANIMAGLKETTNLDEKPSDISQEDWDKLSQEEKNKIKEC